nr:MAG TPA: hypothetical protein [Caudoviricetes sp.]
MGQRGIGSNQVYKQQLLFGSCCLLFGKNKVKIPKNSRKFRISYCWQEYPEENPQEIQNLH